VLNVKALIDSAPMVPSRAELAQRDVDEPDPADDSAYTIAAKDVKRRRQVRRCRLITGETVEGVKLTRTPAVVVTATAKPREQLSPEAQEGLDQLEATP